MNDDFSTFSDGSDDDSLMINLSNVEAQSFEVMPKGRYPIVVEETEFQISKSSGKPMWSVRFSITEGDFANRKLFTYMSFSDKALSMTKGNLAALGMTELMEGSFNPKRVAEEGLLVGKTAIAVVAIEKGNDGNEDRNTVKRLVAATDADNGDGFTV